MKILCAVDGSEYSLWGLDALGSMFHQSIAEVILLHVIDTTPLTISNRRDKAIAVPTKKVIKAMELKNPKFWNIGKDFVIQGRI